MKKTIGPIIIFLILLVACQTDRSSYSTEENDSIQNSTVTYASEHSDKNNPPQPSLSEKTPTGSESSSSRTIIQKVEPLVSKEVIEKKKEEIIEKSPNKEKTCEEIFKEYQQVIDNFIKTKNEDVLLPLDEWDNDPFFNDCRKKEGLKDKFNKWEAKLNTF